MTPHELAEKIFSELMSIGVDERVKGNRYQESKISAIEALLTEAFNQVSAESQTVMKEIAFRWVAAEREACAKVAEALDTPCDCTEGDFVSEIADQIRRRGEK